MNGFAINSTLIGKDREIHGPFYVSDGWTGAETVSEFRLNMNLPHIVRTSAKHLPTCAQKFLEKIYKKRTDLEGICDDTVEEGCFWAWWNWNDKESRNAKPPKTLESA